MSEDLPPNLRRMLDDLPVGQPRLGELLTARRAQRQRRWAVMGTAAATVAIVGGGFAVAQVGDGATGTDHAPVAAESPPGDEPDAPRPTHPEGTAVELPTSNWRPGDGGMRALIHGTLSTDGRGCVVLRHGGGKTAVLWPADYSALIDTDGRLHLLGPDGTAVARDGDEVSMGGGYVPAGDNQHPCVRGKKEVAWVQGTVSVAERGADHALPELPEPTGSPDDRAYQQWLEREPLPDCGSQWFTWRFDSDASMVDFNHARCLRDASAQGSSGGEAIERFTTVEGDPITRYLRVLPGGEVEVFTDSTLDHLGSGRWHHATCSDLDQALAGRC